MYCDVGVDDDGMTASYRSLDNSTHANDLNMRQTSPTTSVIKATFLCSPSYCLCSHQTPLTLAPYWTYCVTPVTYGHLLGLGACRRPTPNLERARTIGKALFGSN